MAAGSGQIPVTILTGFLGSGKTTLLKHLLAQPELGECAVLINEFGEEAIDHHLLRPLKDDVVLLDSGCLCCTVRGDLVKTLRELVIKRVRGEVPEFQRVLLETTGLADPAPILHSLMTDPLISARYRLDGVVCTVDTLRGEALFDRQREAVKQVALADRLLLTKTDLADPAALGQLTARLRGINPAAPVRPVVLGQLDPAEILNCGLFTTRGKIPDVSGWLRDEAILAARAATCGPGCTDPAHHHAQPHHAHGHSHHHPPHPALDHHDHGPDCGCPPPPVVPAARHEDGIASFVLRYDQPLDWQELVIALDYLAERCGDSLLRVKGIIHAAGQERPVVIHGIGHVFHPAIFLPAWPETPPRSRIVFITRDLAESVVTALFAEALGQRAV